MLVYNIHILLCCLFASNLSYKEIWYLHGLFILNLSPAHAHSCDLNAGIDPSKWEAVFDSFVQADPSTTRTYVTQHLQSFLSYLIQANVLSTFGSLSLWITLIVSVKTDIQL
jgi:hypothetical protein